MADTEEYFPRGGKKPTIKYFKQSGNFLGAAEQGEKKKKKPKKKSEADDGYLSDEATKDVDQSYKNCAARLNYKTIKPGVLVLGRISQVHETKLTVMLPGKMIGTVMACHISNTYNKLLEAYVNDQTDKVTEVQEMFRRGQYVALKVLEVEEKRLMLSMMPQHVYGGKKHTDLQKSDLLQAAVVSVEDHGYVMDIGVANTRPFLPKNNTNPELPLEVGALIWCTVKSVTVSADNSIVTLCNQLEALQRASPRGSSVQQLTPGTPLQLTVEKPLDNGIEGSVLGGETAYIQRDHADNVNGKKPKLGQKVRARVLYVVPTRNTPFLCMRDVFATTQPRLEDEQTIQDGDIVEEAQVIRILGRTVHFKLRAGCVGTMSLRGLRVDENLTDEDVVAKSYPVGSAHKVRVVAYNLCDYTYTVSDSAATLRETYFSVHQLHVGMYVDGTVAHVADDHVLIQLDRLTGFVPHSHLSDTGVFIDPKKATTSKLSKKKYKVGQPVRARVLLVDAVKRSVLLTLKPSLLAEDLDVLDSYEGAQLGKAYKGCIRIIRNDYMLVSFFNNVTAYIPRQYITREQMDNLSDAFHVGQIVNCTIVRCYPHDKKMTGSLVTEPFADKVREKGEKRKNNNDNQEVPNKKKKQDDSPVEEKEKKKKKKEHEDKPNKKKDKKKSESEVDDSDSDHIADKVSKKKSNKKKQKDIDAEDSEENTKVSDESDAIETDVYDDSDVALTPQELELIDISNCKDIKKCKKRVISLLKAINAKQMRINRIDQKIAKIEKKGLNTRNKLFHTAMHSETLVVKERAKKLLDALTEVQTTLKELGFVDKTDVIELRSEEIVTQKRKNKDSESNENVEKKKEKKDKKEKDKSKKEKKKAKTEELKAVESLEPVLKVPSAKDFWAAPDVSSVQKEEEDDLSSSDDEEKEQPKKKRKKQSVAEKLSKLREEEERTRELERRATESESQPRSADQFERVILASPNASELWIAYMAFHLQSTEIEKARAVGRRALNTISFREEQDKLNVWLAMLNLENRFGTKETQQNTLEEALQMNEPYTVHSKLLDIYVETSKQQELLTLVDLMMRKYRREPNAYIHAGSACFRLGLVEKARQVMQKAVSVLEKKEHVTVLVQFALLERSHGDKERAEALFEQVLAVYPQRVDVVAVYVDMLLKGGELDSIRQVMDRMTSQKLPARKMKTLFKKWVEVEEKIGDEDQVERIRQRAMEYIEKAKF